MPMKKNKIDKVLIAKNAQKFAQKGKFDKAISEWEKLLSTGSDNRVYNAIGDLYLKLDKTDEAVAAFKKSAEAFRENELNLKAIAMFTKVINLQPSDVGSKIALAELNAEMGLIGNAVENYLAAAEQKRSNNKIDTSMELYRKALDLAPRNINLKVRIAGIYTEIELLESAVKVYEEAAAVFLSSGDYDKAKMMFLKAVSADPGCTHSLIGLSIIEGKSGNLREAFKYATEALSSAPEDHDAVTRFSDMSVETGNTDDAIRIISELLKRGTPNLQLRKTLVTVYINAGMAEKAWEELSPAIDDLFEEEKWADAMELFKLFKEVEVAEVRARIAGMYKERGNIAAAVCEFKETARLFREKGDVDSELRSYQYAIELAPGDGEILEGIEALQSRCEKDMPAIEETPDLKETEPAFRLDETGPVLKEGRGFALPGVVEKKMSEAEFYEHYGFVNEAVNVYEELLNHSPGDKELTERLELLRSSHEIKERPGERKTQGEQLCGICDKGTESVTNDFYEANGQEAPENPETHYELGFAYIEMGLLDDAINEFRVASNDSLLKIRCCRVIARCYVDGGQYREAIEEFEKIVSELSDDGEDCPDIKYDLADIYAKNSEYDNALKLYDEIKSQDPGYRDVAAKIKEVKSLTISSA